MNKPSLTYPQRTARRFRWRALLTPWRRDEGQAAFEMVLIAPLFFLLVLLMVDMGIYTYGFASVSNGVREGARYAAVGCDGSCTAAKVQERTAQRSGGFLDPGNPSGVTVSWPAGTDRGAPVAVNAQLSHNFIFFPVSLPIGSCADMRLEQQDPSAPSGGSGC